MIKHAPLFLTLALTACSLSQASSADDQIAPLGDPRFGSFGFDVSGMDASVRPGDDFNRLANGTWLDQAEIPESEARYGMFGMLSAEATENVRAIIAESLSDSVSEDPSARLVGALYSSWMNEAELETRGLEPVLPYLAQIDAIESHDQAAALLGSVHYSAPYGMTAFEDLQDSSINLLRVYQSGLTLRNRAYYLQQGERLDAYRSAYRDYIDTLFDLAERSVPEDAALRILAFETQLAEAHWTRDQSRNVQATYNVMSVEELDALAPAFNFPSVFGENGMPIDRLIVVQPSAIAEASRIFAETDIETLRLWMSFRVLSNRADWLSNEFDEAKFNFFGRTLSGRTGRQDRETRGVTLVSSALGDAVGQIYVDRHFPQAAEAEMANMVELITSAYAHRLSEVEWMDEATRMEALSKLSAFVARIGYPEVWESYDGLVFEADDYFGNRARLAEYIWSQTVRSLTETTDPRQWNRGPQSVDASYNAVQNQITFPAGILQAPFFDMNADPAVNFGAIGAVIAHEITHGFDDQGRRYDSDGSLRDWWTDPTESRFSDRAQQLAEQLATYCPIDGVCVNPDASMGETIADLGGLEIAYSAWRTYVDDIHGGEAPTIDGYSGDQRFFFGWAQIWRNLYTEDALRAQLLEGPHAPPAYRINGTVRNMDAWYAAFDVSEDDALYLPESQRVRFWGTGR